MTLMLELLALRLAAKDNLRWVGKTGDLCADGDFTPGDIIIVPDFAGWRDIPKGRAVDYVTNMFPSLALSIAFKRAQTGLFQGKTIQFGNNVPFSYKKTRRTWLPNVQNKRLPSEIVGGLIRVKLTTRALRTIKKVCCTRHFLYSRTKTFVSSERWFRQLPQDNLRRASG